MDRYRVALAGNPNCGKSSLFNALTGSRQHVGNWPGKTVARKQGLARHGGCELDVVDLPGAYSLNAFSLEEAISRDYLVEARPDVVVIVLDAANLERNLYLAVQILELGLPAVVVLNMVDVAAARQYQIDDAMLSRALGAPVVRTVAHRGTGVDELLEEILNAKTQRREDAKGGFEFSRPGVVAAEFNAEAQRREDSNGDFAPLRPGVLALTSDTGWRLDYGPALEEALLELEEATGRRPALGERYPGRWLALTLLQQEPEIEERVAGMAGSRELLVQAQRAAMRLNGGPPAPQNDSNGSSWAAAGADAETLIAEQRYDWIHRLVGEAVSKPAGAPRTTTDALDSLLTSRRWGLPIFLVVMWVVFKITADVSAPYVAWLEAVIAGPVSRQVTAALAWLGAGGGWLESLLVDGVLAGVGGVLVFVPVLMSLYIALALLEDSGYMARAAVVMDQIMSKIGLHGKSFLPMIIGFGCTVPAIYATRTLENERDRLLTGLLVPFMSCGARLPVYILFATIFFPGRAGLVVFALYLLGIVTAMVLGVLLRNTILRPEEPPAFIMELPPYRLPSPVNVARTTWERTGAFIRNAWTIILAVSVGLWLLMAVPAGAGSGLFGQAAVEGSVFASLADEISPLFAPLGFGDWKATGALMTGLLAKEVVVSTLTQTNGLTGPATTAAGGPLAQAGAAADTSFVAATVATIKAVPLVVGIDLSPAAAEEEPTALMMAIGASFAESSQGHAALAGLAFMVFVLLYTPCMVAVAAERQEFGARWMWLSIVGQMLLAWLLAFAVFQGGLWLGLD